MVNPSDNQDGKFPVDPIKPRKKYPSFFRNVIQYIYEYSENSTVHGVKYIGEKKRTATERFFWLVILGLSLYFCTYMIIKTYEKWDKSPVIVSFARSPTPIWEIPFPSVTICSETKSRKSVFNFTETIMKFRTYNNLTDEERDKLDKVALVCENHLFHQGSDFIKYDTIDFLTEIAPPFVESLWQCKWLNTNTTCNDLFTPMLTEEGICFSFNMLDRDELFSNEVYHNKDYLAHGVRAEDWSLEKGYSEKLETDTFPRRAISAGQKAGLSILLRAYDYDLDYICRGPVQGFKINLHHPAEYPLVSQQYFRAPLNQEVIVAVKPDMMTTSDGLKDYEPHRRQCYFPSERELRFFKVYTQQNCEIECLTNYTLKACDCVGYHMPHTEDTKICGSKKLVCMHEAQVSLLKNQVEYGLKKSGSNDEDSSDRYTCDCLPACTSLIYNAETSQADFNWQKVFESYKVNFSEFPGVQMTRVTLFFKEQQFINSERNELYGHTDFFANCGGLLGLFMGFSVLSVVEIIYFLSLRIICNIRKYGHHFWSGSADLVHNDAYDHKRR
ncbi:pickpocket protein 28 [Agrilus planipennis]|uniref:Pickpocket protein 28 n=1 Tax=Agrilus planipennis TaxID=224129 RepID=A0A1W4XR61_AGRPL|nr:pickpocket protein 28 [Agrilus planipennis]XP_025829587.1 pickpocket protein 28 [Agrilus planipennis]